MTDLTRLRQIEILQEGRYMDEKISQRNKIVEDNLRLVTSRVIALNNGIYNDDLFQVGCIGLIRAADNFDCARGCKFSTYAVACIDGDIRKYKRKEKTISWSEISVSDTELETDLPFLHDDIISDIYSEHFRKHLSKRASKIMELRETGLTTTQIGREVGVSQAQVSRELISLMKKYKNYDGIGG